MPWANEHTRAYFTHVLTASRRRMRHGDGFVPVSALFRRKFFRRAQVKRLLAEGLLERAPYDRAAGLCYAFRVPSELHGRLLDAEADVYLAACLPGAPPVPPEVDVVTRETPRRPSRSRLSDPQGNGHPSLVRRALAEMREGVCDEGAVKAHLIALYDTARSAPADIQARMRMRFLNDARCLFEGVLGVRHAHHPDGLVRYALVFEVTKTGRVVQRRGGLQSCSRAMKVAAYSRVEGVHNYDLRQSQPNLLRYVLDREGLPHDALDRLLAWPGGRPALAEWVGIDERYLKVVLYALFFGALLLDPVTAARMAERYAGAVIRAVRRAVEPARFDDVYRRLYDVLGPVAVEARTLAELLVGRYEDHRRATGGRGYPRNACGMMVRLDAEPRGRWNRVALAYELQGLESAAVHRLTLEGPKHGFKVIMNEHDGLVTHGRIPNAAVEEVRRAMEFDDPGPLVLVEKPIGS